MAAVVVIIGLVLVVIAVGWFFVNRKADLASVRDDKAAMGRTAQKSLGFYFIGNLAYLIMWWQIKCPVFVAVYRA